MTQKINFLCHVGNVISVIEIGNPRLFLTLTMELENRDFWAMIYHDLKRGLTYLDFHKNLMEAFGFIARGKYTVSRWFHEFWFGRDQFNDSNRCRRPVSAATLANATCVGELIRENTQITTREIQDIPGIGMSAMNNILHDQLCVHKQCARWVPSQQTEEQKGVGCSDAWLCSTNMTVGVQMWLGTL